MDAEQKWQKWWSLPSQKPLRVLNDNYFQVYLHRLAKGDPYQKTEEAVALQVQHPVFHQKERCFLTDAKPLAADATGFVIDIYPDGYYPEPFFKDIQNFLSPLSDQKLHSITGDYAEKVIQFLRLNGGDTFTAHKPGVGFIFEGSLAKSLNETSEIHDFFRIADAASDEAKMVALKPTVFIYLASGGGWPPDVRKAAGWLDEEYWD